MPDFIREDLSGSRFERVRLIGAEFRAVNLTDVTIRGALVKDARLHGLEMCNVDITGELTNVTVNGVDIGPLVEAELDRQRVRRCLGTLSALQSEAVRLAYYGGFTYHQVAERLEVPLGTIKTRIRDGLIRLRDCMEVTS